MLGLFSNGGCLVYEQLIALRRAGTGVGVRIAGTVFDSCPAYLTLLSGARALTEGIKWWPLRWAGFFVAFTVVCPILGLLFFGRKRPAEYWKNLIEDVEPCPTTYIYSDADRLTDVVRLEELIAGRRATSHATSIAAVNLQTSAHVSHLLHDAARYRSAVLALLSQCGLAAMPAKQDMPR